MKDRISGGEYANSFRTIFVKPTKEGYEITQKGVPGVRKIGKNDIQCILAHGMKKVTTSLVSTAG